MRQMKLHHYLWAVAAACMLLPGCSNEDLSDHAAAPVFIPGNSEVEIRFAAHSDEVSTSVDKRTTVDEDGNLDEMGVFCLARGKQEKNDGAPDISWFDPEDNYASCLMKNVKAKKEGSNVSWEGHYFYPISQFYMYEFYGYYPYAEDTHITYEASADGDGAGGPRHRATVHYTIDGTQDIIWGRATLQDKYAYSARYFRENKDAAMPLIGLQHMLTRLQFQVKPGEDPLNKGSVFEDAGKITVKSIKILDAHSKVDLIVADLEKREQWGEDPSKRLTLAERIQPSADETRADFTLKDAQDGDLQPVAIGTTLNQATRVGGSLMLYPEKKYRLEITLHKEGESPEEGFDITTEEWLTVGPPYGASESDTNLFRQGISYMVTITVNDIEEVKANASLTDWQDSVNGPSVEL